ncbi:TonB-dependent receptor, partial [Acinetobacter baumannii]
FKERLSLSFDYFNNKTEKMVLYEALPAATGFDYAVTNNGAMKTSGLELSVNARIINKSKLKWDVGVLLATYKNRITSLPAAIVTK